MKWCRNLMFKVKKKKKRSPKVHRFLDFWCKESCKTCKRLLKLVVLLTGKLRTGVMWQLRFNKKKQSSLDSLNLGLRLAKNKPK